MKSKLIYLIWAIAFLAAGGLILAGYEWGALSQMARGAIFAVAGVGFFATYVLDGVRKWGWLFPAMFCAAIAVLIGLELAGIRNDSVSTLLIFGSMAAPFYVGYAVNRKQWGLLIPANILVTFTVFSLIFPYVSGPNTALVIFATGLPFLALYLLNRSRHWALITAVIVGVFGCISLAVGMSPDLESDLGGAVFFGLISACFFGIAAWSKKSWWAIIPGGVLASFALVMVLETLIPHVDLPDMQGQITVGNFNWVLFLGFAATFGGLWLMRKTRPTGWAIYPAAGCLAIAGMNLFTGSRFAEYWLATTLLVTGGMFLAVLLTWKRRPAGQPEAHLKA